MELPTRFFLVAGVVVFAVAAYQSVRTLLRTLGERRTQRHLDDAGVTTTARVVAVEPMQRPLNGAAGHPVRLAFQDLAGQPRGFRDTSGLGGYVAREGSEVTIRYSPTGPEAVRVEEIIGPHGPYPPSPGRRSGGPSLMPALLAVGVIVVAGAVAVVFEGGLFDGVAAAQLIPPVFGLIGLGMLAGSAGFAVKRARERARPTEEAVGVVTDVWSQYSSRGGGSGRGSTYPFTVHFTTRDGREVHTRHRVSSSRRLEVHQRVRVVYDRLHPPRFEVAEMRHAVWLLRLVPLFIGTVFMLIGAVWAIVTLT
jgi:hypothetical protein